MSDDKRKWTAQFHVSTDIILDADHEEVTFDHPDGIFSAVIKHYKLPPEVDQALLIVNVSFYEEDIDQTEILARQYLDELLHRLDFACSQRFRVEWLSRIVDTSPNIEQRDQLYFHPAPDDGPFPHLSQDILDTVSTLCTWKSSKATNAALEWFSAALGSKVLEVKFQQFWFVIEILAVAQKDPGKVPDKCSKCQGDLFCPSCNETPTHKPYPKQAILQLIKKTVNGSPDEFFAKVDFARNALMHGRTKEYINQKLEEEGFPLDFSTMINHLGHLAWVSILNSFEIPEGKHSPAFIQANTFLPMMMRAAVRVTTGHVGNQDDPDIDLQPVPDITITIQESNEAEHAEPPTEPFQEEADQ